LKRKGNRIYFSPCIPSEWPSVSIRYRYLNTMYVIELFQPKPGALTKIIINGKEEETDYILLEDNGSEVQVKVIPGLYPAKSQHEESKRISMLTK
jgi:cyclic beta-1,2-glucan synthetase